MTADCRGPSMDIRQNDRLKFDVPTVLFGASPIGPSVLEIAQDKGQDDIVGKIRSNMLSFEFWGPTAGFLMISHRIVKEIDSESSSQDS